MQDNPKLKISTLKMRPEHYSQLKTALDECKETWYGKHTQYRVKGLTPKRYRWDALHVSRLRAGSTFGSPTGWNVYDYLNDENIDSALRQYFREAGVKWAVK